MMFSFRHLLPLLRLRCGIASAGNLVWDRWPYLVQSNQCGRHTCRSSTNNDEISHGLLFFFLPNHTAHGGHGDQKNHLDDGPIAHSLAFFTSAPSPTFPRMLCLFMFEILALFRGTVNSTSRLSRLDSKV
jgi:hypothetical protein